MQADAGFLNHVQADAGFLNHMQAGPPLAQAFRMEAAKKPGGRPGRLGTLISACVLPTRTWRVNTGSHLSGSPSATTKVS
jgi:hypothetical protein